MKVLFLLVHTLLSFLLPSIVLADKSPFRFETILYATGDMQDGIDTAKSINKKEGTVFNSFPIPTPGMVKVEVLYIDDPPSKEPEKEDREEISIKAIVSALFVAGYRPATFEEADSVRDAFFIFSQPVFAFGTILIDDSNSYYPTFYHEINGSVMNLFYFDPDKPLIKNNVLVAAVKK